MSHNGTVREVAEYLAKQAAGGWKGSKSIHPRNWKKDPKVRKDEPG